MCNIQDGFKLCTCDEKLATSDIGWVLKRTNADLPLHHRKGRAVMPRYNQQEKDLQALILENLNQYNCFDFDYTPHENDYVRIRAKASNRTESQWFAYRFQRNRWVVDQSDSLAAWKTQLEAYKNGIIE
ncbi:hypothetical protein BKI52_29010 [marine bacterium AO1-C]|nr:hypothetical protein BKI52_29010 [marine bacterium AO1-C]